MRKPPPVFGTSEIDYRLGPLFVKSHAKYLEKSAEHDSLQAEFEKDRKNGLLIQILQVQEARFEAGVITLFTAASLLERVLYEYASANMHFKSYEDHLDRLKLETKWIVIPKLCKGIHVSEDASEINELRQLIRARNAVVHPKVLFIRADRSEMPDNGKELDRFHLACKNARRTVESLLALLESPVAAPIDPACLI